MQDTVRSLYYTHIRQIEIREEPLSQPEPHQLLVRTLFSAISPGTEMLVFRGEAPEELKTDEGIAALGGQLTYPLKYGYACVGEVIGIGNSALAGWMGRIVFSFQPHQTHFLATPDQIIPLPEGLTPEQALFLPNMETAVNFIMDGHPLIGERVAVFGQGIVGLLTTALLVKFPLKTLTTFEHFPLRRAASLEAGADTTRETSQTAEDRTAFFDLTYELTGSPAVLDAAIAVTGFDGRIVIGSWYGKKRAAIDLGGTFHRSRIRLISSQVSTLAPHLTGRWDKARRFEVAWDMIRRVHPERWITQRIPFGQAEDAFLLLDNHPDQTIQVILDYQTESLPGSND